MAFLFWDRKYKENGYLLDKLTLLTLLRISLSTFRERNNYYDGLKNDPIKEAYLFLKKNKTKSHPDDLINCEELERIFGPDCSYEKLETKTISNDELKKILDVCKLMIRKKTTNYQIIKVIWGCVFLICLFLNLLIISLFLYFRNIGELIKLRFIILVFIFSALLFISLYRFILYIKWADDPDKRKKKVSKELKGYYVSEWNERELLIILDTLDQNPKAIGGKRSVKNCYERMSVKELREQLFVSYPDIKEKYPLFLEFWQYKKYLDLDNKLIVPQELQKNFLYVINSLKNGENDLELVRMLFKPSYSETALSTTINRKTKKKANKIIAKFEIDYANFVESLKKSIDTLDL